MKTVVIAATIWLAATIPCLGQTKEEALKRVSDVLAEINTQDYATMGSDMPVFAASSRIQEALEKLNALKRELANNPYVRISSITVGIPWGVSIELEVLGD